MHIPKKKYCIVGTGGFGREVLCCLKDFLGVNNCSVADWIVFMVSDEYYKEAKVLGVPVIRRSELVLDDYQLLVAIGDPAVRKATVAELPRETCYATLIHPSVTISEWVDVGVGTIITAGCAITCNIRFGRHSHLNLNTTIGHDGDFGDYFTTAPGANISGNCSFGECVYFGTGSSVRQGVNICDNVTIGMGGIVVNDIVEEGVYIGAPVQRLIK